MITKIKVLIANDNKEFCTEIATELHQYGVSCISCLNESEEIVRIVNRFRPHVVIIDVSRDGSESVKTLQNMKLLHLDHPPYVITISGSDDRQLQNLLLRNGASCHYLKPFDLHHIADHIVNVAFGNEYEIVKESPFKKRTVSETVIEYNITEIINDLGIPAHYKGYHYLRDAILMCIRTPHIINFVTRQLYPNVANLYGTTPIRVERAIRNAIETAWKNNADEFKKYFGKSCSVSGKKPTNSEFIAVIADKLRLKIKMVQ